MSSAVIYIITKEAQFMLIVLAKHCKGKFYNSWSVNTFYTSVYYSTTRIYTSKFICTVQYGNNFNNIHFKL